MSLSAARRGQSLGTPCCSSSSSSSLPYPPSKALSPAMLLRCSPVASFLCEHDGWILLQGLHACHVRQDVFETVTTCSDGPDLQDSYRALLRCCCENRRVSNTASPAEGKGSRGFRGVGSPTAWSQAEPEYLNGHVVRTTVRLDCQSRVHTLPEIQTESHADLMELLFAGPASLSWQYQPALAARH